MTVYTESQIFELLAKRYTRNFGNGEAWVFMPKVRSAAGFDAERTADALAMSLWPSKDLELHGFEVKISRSDWLRELKNPEKSAPFIELVDRWFIVAPKDIVKKEELPQNWGLIEVISDELKISKSAPTIHRSPKDAISRSMVACMLRSAIRWHNLHRANKNILEYKECDCDWSKNIEIEGNCTRKCGCGQEHMMKCRHSIVHLNDKDWIIDCAYKHILGLLNAR